MAPASSRARRQLVFGLALAPLLALGCGSSSHATRKDLPPPIERTQLSPLDVFTMEIVGEKDLPREYQVGRDGTVEFPYLHRVKVAGMEPQEIAELVRTRLVELKILVDPTVIVTAKEYRSRNVTLDGQVAKPGTFPMTPGLTLMGAIAMAGGLTSIAKSSAVKLTRTTGNKTITVVVSVDAINDGEAKDIKLQAGDRVFVDQRVF